MNKNIPSKKPRKPGSGGKRTGAGRKPKAPTVTISFRVPADRAEVIKAEVMRIIHTFTKFV